MRTSHSCAQAATPPDAETSPDSPETPASCHTVPADIGAVAALALSVNPEARIYATVEQHALHACTVGTTLPLPVAVLNTGYVTAPIQPILLAPADGSVELTWDAMPLSGEDREDRILGVIAHVEGFIDITVGFSFPCEPPDLGGRDRLAFLVKSSSGRKATAGTELALAPSRKVGINAYHDDLRQQIPPSNPCPEFVGTSDPPQSHNSRDLKEMEPSRW